MNHRHTLSTVAMFAVAALVPACTEPNPQAVRSYCDEQGCFQCDVGGSCAPVPNAPCERHDQCGNGGVCTTVGCANACEDSGTCGDGMECVRGFCVPDGFAKVAPKEEVLPCSHDSDCAIDDYCDIARSTCVPRCQHDQHCAPDEHCLPCGKCQPKELPATCGWLPEYCQVGDENSCGADKSCVAGRCHFSCETADACPIGQICSNGVCLDDPEPESPECLLNAHCADGACINGFCHPACEQNETCGPQMLCQMGLCQVDYRPNL